VREATEYYGEFVRFSLQASELPVKVSCDAVLCVAIVGGCLVSVSGVLFRQGDDIELTKLDFIVKHGNVPYKEFVE